MSEENIKDQLTAAMKNAMKAKQKERLGVIRMALSALKQIEVDERITLDNPRILSVMDKLVKQRRESAKQYTEAKRSDLAEIELAEVVVLQEFLPEALNDDQLAELIKDAIESSGASGMQDMGKVMSVLKPKLQGRADIGAVSQQLKGLLQQA